jgi:hypothetical protein
MVIKYSLFFLLFSLFLAKEVRSQGKLELVALTDKSVYLEGEPIWLTFQLNSKSGQPLSIYSDCIGCGDIRIVLKDSHGKEIKDRGPMYNRLAMKSPPIIVTTSFWDMESILDWHGKGEGGSGFFHFLQSGTYTIDLVGDEGAILNEKENRTILHSNTVSFKVVVPEGEEKEVRSLYLEAISPTNHKSYSDVADKLSEIIKNHPRSAYVGRVTRILAMTYHVNLHDKAKGENVLREFVQKYPDDPYNFKAVNELLSRKKDAGSRIGLLDSLSNAHPKSFQAKVVNRIKELNAYKQRKEK